MIQVKEQTLDFEWMGFLRRPIRKISNWITRKKSLPVAELYYNSTTRKKIVPVAEIYVTIT